MNRVIQTFPHRQFGKRQTPPLTAEQKAEAEALLRETERFAMRARCQAYLDAHWEESAAGAWASLRTIDQKIARRRLGTIGGGVLQGLVGFAVGLRLGR